MVTEQLGKYIKKYEDKETDLNYNANEFRLIGEFLTDLNALLRYAQEKQAACCAKNAGKQNYCGQSDEMCAKAIQNHDIIPEWCPL